MASKKSILAVALVFAAGAILTACDEVVAKPTDYKDAIVLGNNGEKLDIVNNEMQKVYDQIRNGALASDVLNEFLYQYAVSAFGAYNHVVAPKDVYTLKDAVKEINAKATFDTNGAIATIDVNGLKGTKANDFIKEHKAYWTVDDDNNRIHYDSNGEATTVEAGADADELEYARVYAKWDAIEHKIAHTLYSAVANGAYSKRNVFHEKEYVWSLYGNMKKVADPSALTTSYSGLIWPEVEDYEVFTKTVKDINDHDDKLLHRENYQLKYALTDEETAANAVTYVEDDIIPDIYRTLLVEQYLLDESYPTLGRSYARKVNIVKITGSSTYTKGASYLLDAFLDEVIFNEKGEAAGLDEFKLLSSAWTGAFMSESTYTTSEEYKLWKATGLVGANGEYEKDGSYIAGTAYGDMMEKYNKINDNPALSENSGEFTGSNSYVKETGKEISTREIATRDHTTTGWYIKNGGLTELPDSIRNRLFNISVANAVNLKDEQKALVERAVKGEDNKYTYDASKDYNNYVAQINGKHYLKVGSKVNNADPKDDILFVDGDNYYIVQIEEAVSSSKLSRTQQESYLKQVGPAKMEEIVNEVVKMVADSDSYRTLSKKFWLEQANLKFHDTVIYNYFKSNFPELFND